MPKIKMLFDVTICQVSLFYSFASTNHTANNVPYSSHSCIYYNGILFYNNILINFEGYNQYDFIYFIKN